jgi:hypothetical protein
MSSLEDELERARRDLRRVQEEFEEFVDIASHDLHEPLRTVVSFSELLELGLGDDLDEKHRRYLAYLVDGARRMRSLLDDLLVLSRAGRAPVFRPFEVGSAVESALVVLRPQLEQANAEVTVEDLPTVTGDPQQIEVVFRNLLENAIVFRSPERPLQIRVSGSRAADVSTFGVHDNGFGIAAERAPSIFVPFRGFQVGETKPGRGMGLAVVARIVGRHEGRVWCENTEGSGASLLFTIPDLDPTATPA